MTPPPLVCPTPEPDCPLYNQRAVYSPDEMLRRAVFMERRNVSNLAALIRAEVPCPRPQPPALPPAPAPPTWPLPLIPQPEKKGTR